MRKTLSEKNPYYLPRDRYYELKYFCRQYPVWKQAYASVSGLPRRYDCAKLRGLAPERMTEKVAETMEYFGKRIEFVEAAAKETDDVLGSYILEGVTKGLSYDVLCARKPVPCCREKYYELYRKFFWTLSQMRR